MKAALGTGPVALLGLGALGGSLARGLKALAAPPVIHGHAADPLDLSAASAAGVVDRAFPDARQAVAGAGLVVVAAPLGAEERLFREMAPAVAPEAVILDVASLQAPALAAASAAGLEARFVACHPMAGSEESGFEAGRGDLFAGAPVFLATLSDHPGPGEAAEALWSALGAHPRWMDPDVHDTRMAVVSHLPQVVANGLARVLEEGGFTPQDLGPGGRAMTRLAASSPAMWRDLLAHSGPQVAALLRLLSRELDGWARVLDSQDLDELERRMHVTRQWRRP